MKSIKNKIFRKYILFFLVFANFCDSDSFVNNSFNNHGTVGLINMPTARFYNEEVHGVTIYDGTPDQKITLTASPYNWMEASFFYTRIQDKLYCEYIIYEFCRQSAKDKGFNIKLRLKEEGLLPAIAVGVYDIAGTGYYSSEYIVASYGINKFDFHFGLGWGLLNGSNTKIKNPFGLINDQFYSRPTGGSGYGGTFQPERYFSNEKISPFFGVSHAFGEKLLLKLEYDSTETPGNIGYELPKEDYSFGLEYKINNNFIISLSSERGSYSSLRFVYKNDPKSSVKKYEYKEANVNENDNKYVKLIKNLEENNIGVNKITETSRSLGLELTQFFHSDIRLIEEIIKQSSIDAGIDKDIKKDIKIADLDSLVEIDKAFERNSKLIYERDSRKGANTFTRATFRPFLASREEFFKGAFLIENDTEFIIKDNLFFNTNLKYSIADNFDDLRYGPQSTFPAQVRSDVKQYLVNYDRGILIGRAQLDYHITPKKNHHIMMTAGILEDMFSGIGMEYLYHQQSSNYSLGFEIFDVYKRDYDWGFGLLGYKNTIAHANLYYRNYGTIPFDMRLTAGEYLAGDVGSTIEFSRSFRNGVQFGVFATFTDVSREQFGEGSFDKGIFFNIPIYGNFINYTWKPLTKDPGATLSRRTTLQNLLVRYRPIE